MDGLVEKAGPASGEERSGLVVDGYAGVVIRAKGGATATVCNGEGKVHAQMPQRTCSPGTWQVGKGSLTWVYQMDGHNISSISGSRTERLEA
jgi:hypothetical protein